jgi:hypothetical protein
MLVNVMFELRAASKAPDWNPISESRNPDDVVRTIERMVHHASGREGEDVDLTFMKQLVLLACAICPHATTERDEDIRLLRHLASQFAMEGQFQQARDFAEQILLMGQTSAYRCRLAWQAFGDVYHRCRNHVVALVSLACAMAVDVAVEKADLWHEVYAVHRVLRDLGLFELSRSFLPTMKTLLSDLGFDADSVRLGRRARLHSAGAGGEANVGF